MSEPLSHKEIARRLGISPGTVVNYERRALEKIRRGLMAKFGVAWTPEASIIETPREQLRRVEK